MNLFMTAVVTPPEHLPITASDTDLAAAVVEEVELTVLWRAVVAQERRIVLDGALPQLIEIEPTTDISSLTRWTNGDPAEVVDSDSYEVVSRDPLGTILTPAPSSSWPAPERSIGSFALTYTAGWVVTPESSPGANDAINLVPASIQLMLKRAIEFRAGSGVGDLSIGSLKIGLAKSYKTDAIPPEIRNIARGHFYRPGLIFADRP